MRPSRLLLLCGSGHNGSTILARILLAHCSIGGQLSETFLFGLTPEGSWPGVFEQLARQFCHPQWLLEKTPLHIFNASRILEILPSSHCLCLIRDGREVVASMLRRSLSLESSIKRWTSASQESLILRSLFPSRTLLVRYEELVTLPKRTLGNIADFLGVHSSPLIKASLSCSDTNYLGHRVDSREAISNYASHKDVSMTVPHNLRRATQAALPLGSSPSSGWHALSSDCQRRIMLIDDFVLLNKIFGYMPWDN